MAVRHLFFSDRLSDVGGFRVDVLSHDRQSWQTPRPGEWITPIIIDTVNA